MRGVQGALIGVGGAAALVGVLIMQWRQPDGCRIYTPVPGKVLIAHAGGGLPDATYTNSIEAMDRAARNGFRFIEIDFWESAGEILLSHERPDGGEVTARQLLRWMEERPGILIVTDFKTPNVAGLEKLAALAGPMSVRFIPQIYNPSEYEAVARLRMQKPILTVYRVSEPWVEFARAADLLAVTMPVSKRHLAAAMNKPVLLHTVNEDMGGDVAGYYTDCLRPDPNAPLAGLGEIR